MTILTYKCRMCGKRCEEKMTDENAEETWATCSSGEHRCSDIQRGLSDLIGISKDSTVVDKLIRKLSRKKSRNNWPTLD